MRNLKHQYHSSLTRKAYLQYIVSAKGVMGLYFILLFIKWYEYGYKAFCQCILTNNTAWNRFIVVMQDGIAPAMKYVVIAIILDLLFWPYLKNDN